MLTVETEVLREKKSVSATLSTTNPTLTGLRSTLGICDERPVTNCWSYGRNVKYITSFVLVS
jgi:hypothetical protein